MHRVIDVGNLYIDFKNDDSIPNLEECKKRAGIENTTVSHKAVEDARDVVLTLREKY